MLATDITLSAADYSQQPFPYRSPMKFGGRVVKDVILFDVAVTVTCGNRSAVGRGSMTMGNVWAWPSNQLSAEETLKIIVALAEKFVQQAANSGASGHPIEISHALAAEQERIATDLANELSLPEAVPQLAVLLAASPLDAAIHDAFGRIHKASCFSLVGSDYLSTDLSIYLGEEFAGESLTQTVSAKPQHTLPLYHLVGALDPLTPSDVSEPVGDGLPETLADWIVADGLTHLKIKLNGDDLDWDVNRVIAIDQVATEQATDRSWNYSCDFNERCSDVAYVIDFLNQIKEKQPAAFDRIQYLEQPTHRDLKSHPENKMHAAAKIKPVVIDESLIDLESLLLARELGYSGVALKACKGQSEAILMAAAAQKHEMFLCVQDLTCVGASFLHSASLAAHIPAVAAIEGNGRQYCPQGNVGWEENYPGMFSISNGRVQTSELDGIGLGFDWR
jgi:L-alanine-DL-glutamate epimerase-like enolase superfamily enzyme